MTSLGWWECWRRCSQPLLHSPQLAIWTFDVKSELVKFAVFLLGRSGYRDAQLAWLLLPGLSAATPLPAPRAPPVGSELGAARSGQAPGARPQHATQAAPPVAAGFSAGFMSGPDAPSAVLLAVYAPRLGRVDVYPARQGSRVASVRTHGGPACLLCAGALFGRGSPLAAGGRARRDAGALEGSGVGLGGEHAGACWMLECASGELWSVDAAVAAALGAAGTARS